MSRLDPRVVAVVAVTLVGIGLVMACNENDNACTADIECAPGSFCRAGFCAAVENDAGAADGQVPIQCVAQGGSCSFDDECCVRPCTSFRCGGPGSSGTSGRPPGGSSGTSGTGGSSGSTSSGGSCADLYGLCAADFDCCPGLSCTTGVCR